MTPSDTIAPGALAAMTGVEQDGPPPSVPAKKTRKPRGSAPATTVEYRIYLDGIGVEAVGEWEADHAETTAFCKGNSVETERTPDVMDEADLRWVDTIAAADRDAAVAALLKGEGGSGEQRAHVVRAAHEAHVNLDFHVVAAGKVGVVPVHWKVEPTFSIGGKG